MEHKLETETKESKAMNNDKTTPFKRSLPYTTEKKASIDKIAAVKEEMETSKELLERFSSLMKIAENVGDTGALFAANQEALAAAQGYDKAKEVLSHLSPNDPLLGNPTDLVKTADSQGTFDFEQDYHTGGGFTWSFLIKGTAHYIVEEPERQTRDYPGSDGGITIEQMDIKNIIPYQSGSKSMSAEKAQAFYEKIPEEQREEFEGRIIESINDGFPVYDRDDKADMELHDRRDNGLDGMANIFDANDMNKESQADMNAKPVAVPQSDKEKMRQAIQGVVKSQYVEQIPIGEICQALKTVGVEAVQEDGEPLEVILSGKKECGTPEAEDQRAMIDLVKNGNLLNTRLLLSWCKMPESNNLEFIWYLT